MQRMDQELLDHARDHLDAAIDLRRRLHRRPELALHLPITQETVLSEIDGLGLDISTGTGLSSITAVLDSGRPGPAVILRADMDALPMPEDTGLDYASTVDGAMHACGHDAHTAMLVGAARVLHERRGEFAGRVVLMFQPGEEGHHGAKHMLDEGLLDIAGPDIAGAFAIHQSPTFPAGMIATKGGPLLASADVLRITVTGRGGHASMPHHALDPVPIACEIVLAIQSMVTRTTDVFDPAVVTVAKIRTGTTNNVIPETAYIEGTVRALSARTRQRIHDHLARLAEGIAGAHGAAAEVVIDAGFPVTVNDDDFAAWTRQVAAGLVGDDLTLAMRDPVMGAEDFSYVLEQVPGAMAFLGTRPEGRSMHDVAPNHSNRMVIDEPSMLHGIAMYAAVALGQLVPA
jgi:amidohydrolase